MGSRAMSMRTERVHGVGCCGLTHPGAPRASYKRRTASHVVENKPRHPNNGSSGAQVLKVGTLHYLYNVRDLRLVAMMELEGQ